MSYPGTTLLGPVIADQGNAVLDIGFNIIERSHEEHSSPRRSERTNAFGL
jgi:ribose 5-phosphate isomerase